jgi:hypothetical protein
MYERERAALKQLLARKDVKNKRITQLFKSLLETMESVDKELVGSRLMLHPTKRPRGPHFKK